MGQLYGEREDDSGPGATLSQWSFNQIKSIYENVFPYYYLLSCSLLCAKLEQNI